jgi:hypothetical protein
LLAAVAASHSASDHLAIVRQLAALVQERVQQLLLPVLPGAHTAGAAAGAGAGSIPGLFDAAGQPLPAAVAALQYHYQQVTAGADIDALSFLAAAPRAPTSTPPRVAVAPSEAEADAQAGSGTAAAAASAMDVDVPPPPAPAAVAAATAAGQAHQQTPPHAAGRPQVQEQQQPPPQQQPQQNQEQLDGVPPASAGRSQAAGGSGTGSGTDGGQAMPDASFRTPSPAHDRLPLPLPVPPLQAPAATPISTGGLRLSSSYHLPLQFHPTKPCTQFETSCTLSFCPLACTPLLQP